MRAAAAGVDDKTGHEQEVLNLQSQWKGLGISVLHGSVVVPVTTKFLTQ
jgi:hypothetical protein